MNGSDPEPLVPLPHEADEQMRTATERLRDKAWMVIPVTGAPSDASVAPDRER